LKLLNCTSCHDIVKLKDGWRWCACGLAAARLLRDKKFVEVWGEGRVLVLDDVQYGRSISNRKAKVVEASVMTEGSEVRRVKNRPHVIGV